MQTLSSTLAVTLLSAALTTNAQAMVPKTVPQNVADRYGAKCLNGELPQYYIRRNASSTGWVLFLEGGGWCFGPDANSTIASCARRAGFKPASDAASHVRAAAPVDDYGGILGASAEINPDFYTWNAVFMHYCDGASFGGLRSNPIDVKTREGAPAKMYMRGRANFDALIRTLLEDEGMSKATEVILSGGSAGGLATFYNLDHLATLLPVGARLTGFPDAGYFLDAANVQTGEYMYRNNFIAADPVWNVTGGGGTNARCLAAHASSGDAWKCLMAPYLIEYIQTPVFVMNSAYDAYQLPNIAGVSCVSTAADPCNDTDSQLYGEMFKKESQRVLNASPKNGIYVDGCFVHEQNVNYCSTQNVPNCVGWSPEESGSQKWNYTTRVSGLTPQQAFSRYYFGGERAYLDASRLQQNPTCIYNKL